MNTEQKIELLKELMECGQPVSVWCFDEETGLLYSNCPQEDIYLKVLDLYGCRKTVRDFFETESKPLMLGTPIGLCWLFDAQKRNENICCIYAVGPIISSQISGEVLGNILNEEKSEYISVSWKKRLTDAIEKLPLISPILVNYYAVMLHYFVTGEKIGNSEIAHYQNKIVKIDLEMLHDRNKTWKLEQGMLRMIQEGNLNYKQMLNNMTYCSAGVSILSKDPLRQAKDSVIISVSLCTRAAIEGGLSPELAYSLGDAYIQKVEDCRDSAEPGAIHQMMYDDFVHRVHNMQNDRKLPPAIRECCDYIDMHIEEKLSIEELAKRTGYTEYYLSRRFKEEVGVSIKDYVKQRKIMQAELLLISTDLDIQEISEKLNFCTRSRFGEVFRKVAGCSPREYREGKRGCRGGEHPEK